MKKKWKWEWNWKTSLYYVFCCTFASVAGSITVGVPIEYIPLIGSFAVVGSSVIAFTSWLLQREKDAERITEEE